MHEQRAISIDMIADELEMPVEKIEELYQSLNGIAGRYTVTKYKGMPLHSLDGYDVTGDTGMVIPVASSDGVPMIDMIGPDVPIDLVTAVRSARTTYDIVDNQSRGVEIIKGVACRFGYRVSVDTLNDGSTAWLRVLRIESGGWQTSVRMYPIREWLLGNVYRVEASIYTASGRLLVYSQDKVVGDFEISYALEELLRRSYHDITLLNRNPNV